jgi:hypothetical protein
MTKSISEKSNVRYSDLYEENKNNYVYITRYFDLDRGDFCCNKIYDCLLGDEIDGKCELYFGYNPEFREYFINVRTEYGGGAVKLIGYCPWCGNKLPKSLRHE